MWRTALLPVIIIAAFGVQLANAQQNRTDNNSAKKAAATQPKEGDPAAGAAGAAGCAGCGACGGGTVFLLVAIPVAAIVLNIALLVWVAKDAKARGLDNSVMWMILVMFTGLLGFIIYIFSRPQGSLVVCRSCNNKKLQASRRCPHCGNSKSARDEDEEIDEDDDDQARSRR